MTGMPARTSKGPAGALLSLSALAALAVLAGCGGSSPKPAKPVAGLPAKQILAEALASARSAGSMSFNQYEGTVSSSNAQVVVTGDALPTMGRQVAKGDNGAVMTELVLPGGTYLRGNAAAMTGFVGMSARKASRFANRWMVLHAGDPNYQQITEGVTGDSVLSSITPAGVLTKGKKLQKIGSQSVVAVSGLAPTGSGMAAGSTDTLWVAATGKPLPVAAEEVSKSGGDSELVFTRSSWGKKVTGVTAPAGAVTYPAG
jgi:hypothetical protein